MGQSERSGEAAGGARHAGDSTIDGGLMRTDGAALCIMGERGGTLLVSLLPLPPQAYQLNPTQGGGFMQEVVDELVKVRVS